MKDQKGPLTITGRLLVPDGLRPGRLHIRDGKIEAIVLDVFPSPVDGPHLEADLVAPGFIDLQVNGGYGVEVEGNGSIEHLAARLPETGVTAFLPTVVTSAPETYRAVFQRFTKQKNARGASPLGLHLEGPFLSTVHAGAHRQEVIESADEELFLEILATKIVAMVTIAPERKDAIERIHKLRARGVVVSLGHTDADAESFRCGIDAGATMVTHLYNAMSAFEHRSPGAVGAALVDDRVTVGLIADGIHSHAFSLELALRAKGMSRIALVTDAMAAAGAAPGVYELGGQKVLVDRCSARLADGTLAGSILTMDQAVRNVIRLAGASVEQALRMASEVPARVLGIEARKSLAVGSDADLVLLDSDLRVRATVIDGGVVHQSA